MKLKKFNDYLELHSKDPKTFEKRVIFCGANPGIELFKMDEGADFSQTDLPIIFWGDASKISENVKFKPIPTMGKIRSEFSGASFLPRSVSDRDSVKKLRFPVLGVGNGDSCEFKTYGKFKKSEKNFPVFREKITPITRFDLITHKGEPIHLQEKINRLGFDVNLSRFNYLTEAEEIAEKLHKKYGLGFCHLSLLEADNKLYLEDVTTSLNLSPSQSIKMYEKAYESFYETRLPEWFKKQAFEKHVKPYYKKRYYDSLLIKPKNSISFEKYLDT